MIPTFIKNRQRFLSEQLSSLPSLEEEPPMSPPTPKIEPLKMPELEELEELSLLPSENIEDEVCREFTIDFSTNDEKAPKSRLSTIGEYKMVKPWPAQQSRLQKMRSKSYCVTNFNQSIFGYLMTAKERKN